MFASIFRWLSKNISTLLLAFILSVVVWVSAVVTADPNEEHISHPIRIEVVGQDPKLMLIGEIPETVQLTLKAPRSIWNELNDNPKLIQAWIDLSGLEPGEHNVEVRTSIDINPIRFVNVDPQDIRLTLEPLAAGSFPIELSVNGEPPLGYKKGTVLLEPNEVTVSGPASSVEKVALVRSSIDISGESETLKTTIPVEVVDENGETIHDVTVTPNEISVTQPINLLGGFKNVVVKVTTTGQVANGYRLTNVSVSPPTVTVFSEDPRKIDGIPGFVDTLPVDLTDLSDDIEINVGLSLPPGIELVRVPDVLVQVSLAAIESSRTYSVPVEVVGLAQDLEAAISPVQVDVIAAGPINILEMLTPADFRIILDLEGLPAGIYQRSPEVERVPDQVRVQTTLPETVEVDISVAPTPTPTATVLATPSVTPTP